MSLRARLLIIIGLGVVVIAAVSTVIVLSSRRQAATPEGTAPDTTGGLTAIDSTNFDAALREATLDAAAPVPSGVPVKKQSPEEAQQGAAKQVARVFVERYGTYSTDSNFENVNEVRELVTPALWQRIAPKSATMTGPFVRVATQAVNVDLAAWSAAQATVKLTAVNTEEKEGQAVVRKDQAVTIILQKSGTQWLVDQFSIEQL